jgi:hypothetical protein
MAWIISQRHSSAWQVIVFAQELLLVEALPGFVSDAPDLVTIREHCVPVGVDVSAENGGFTDAAGSQKQGSARNFRIFFLSTEASQKGHGSYGALESEVR